MNEPVFSGGAPRLAFLQGPAAAPWFSKNPPPWIRGTIETPAGSVPTLRTALERSEIWEHARCRISGFRDSYTVPPGLYAVGSPAPDSKVLVSANYKLSFDTLRRELSGLDLWILVLDTKGINVWCAAGKGTFGTEELIHRIKASGLERVVSHRSVIVPQLGAPGVSGYRVQAASHFRVVYGPVCAKDIPAFLSAGCRATEDMRRVRFSWKDRAVLTPMEINPAMRNYYPLFAAAILLIFGLQPYGILFRDALTDGAPYLLHGLLGVVSGALLTPVLLPFIPFRSFAVKGWLMGLATLGASVSLSDYLAPGSALLTAFTWIFFPAASSYLALQFTGSTTFTGMSGVRKELRIAIPLYLFCTAVSAGLLITHKLHQWSVL